MKSDKKSKKRDYSDSEEETVVKTKKRRYRNDRSRKKDSSSDDSDSSPGRRKKSDKRSEKKRDSSSESSEERSRKNKKKKQKDTSEDDSSSSEEEKVKKSKRHESKRKSRKKSPKQRSSPSSRKKSSKRKSPTRSSRKKQSSESPSPDARKVKSKVKSPKPKSPKPKSKSPTPQRTTAKSSSKQSGSPAIEDSPAKSADSSADSSQISIASPPVVKTHVKDIPVKIELPKHKQSDDVSYDIIFSDEFLQSRVNDKKNLGDENEFTEESSMDVLEDIVKSKLDDAEDDIKSTLPQEKEEQPVKSPKEEKKDLSVVTKAVSSSENTEASKKENSKGEAPQKVESKTEEKHREVKHEEDVTKEIKKEEQTIEPVKKEEVKEPVEKIKEEAVKTEESENDEEDSLVIKPPESKVKKESKSKSSVSDKGKRSKSPASKRRKSKSPPRNKRSYRKRSRSPRSSRRSSSRSPTRRKRSPDRKKSDDKKSEKSKSSQEIKSKELKKEDKALRKRKERLDEWRKAQMKSTTETSADSAAAATENGTSEDALQKEVKKEDKISEEVLKPKKIEVKITSGVKKFEIVNKTVLKKKPLVAIKMEMEEVDDTKEEEENDEDMDPLDAYMKQIDKQVGKIKKKPTKKLDGKGKTLMVVKTVVKKKEAPVTAQKTKPELMEQNQDAMEYSSEGEAPGDVTAGDFTDITKKKKELTVADHSKIYYAAFKRDFYVEVPELARMTADEVKLYRETLGDIQVRGKNIPKPIRSWSQAGVSTKVMNVLKKLKYEKPTPIQAQAIPAVMSGRDMIGIAKTGSGKTLAFLIPMFRHVLDQPALDEQDGPIAIIMTPTRELALQIFREAKKFCKALHLTAACIYGGSGISEQIAELKKGAEIIVCTPGRMIDMLTANNGKVTNCRRSTYLVLDEADRMFDMGFEPQVMRIIDNIRPDRQTVLFSATFPRQMEAVARKVLSKPIEIQVGGRSIVCSDVEQHALVIEEENKFFKTLELLGGYQEKGSVLIFVEKQESADALFKDLLKNGYPCLSLHGGMDQFDRDSTIADFKNGVTKLMVSTSVAARGLDVKNLVLVLNYDCPNHYEDYVHRVGRTGRAGNKGTSFTYLTPEQGRNAGDVIRAFELAKSSPPEDVVKLYETFKEEMKAAGKTVRANSGFTGKGFKFNQEEDSQVVDAKKQQKFSLGLQTSDDEAEAAENALEKIDADLEKAFSNKPKIALAPEVVEAQKTKAAEHTVDKGKVNQASKLVALLNKKLSSGQVVDRNTQATASILSGGSLASLKGVGLAKQLADKVNAKLNYIKVDEPERVEPVEAKPSSNVRYEEEIDINDFPQSARWRITSKEIIEQVREISECGLTVRGIYIPPNKKPDEDDRRLHLYLESLNERAIEIAKAEIKRLLREELIKAESRSYKPHQQTGRYKVL